jgi:hypothetical protein
LTIGELRIAECGLTIGGGPDWRNVVHPTGLGGMGQLVDPWDWTGAPEEDLTASVRKNDSRPPFLAPF